MKHIIMKSSHLLWMVLVVTLPLMGAVSSCGKELGRPQTTQVSISLINPEGKKANQFERGEIPIVVFEVVNTGDELRLYPPLHYGEHILLYGDQPNSEPIGNFYSNGQLTNHDGPAIYQGKTITKIQLPWVWTDELRGEIIEFNLDGEEINRRETTNSFDPADNPDLAKGNYRVKLSLPAEWEIPVAQSEVTFRIN